MIPEVDSENYNQFFRFPPQRLSSILSPLITLSPKNGKISAIYHKFFSPINRPARSVSSRSAVTNFIRSDIPGAGGMAWTGLSSNITNESAQGGGGGCSDGRGRGRWLHRSISPAQVPLRKRIRAISHDLASGGLKETGGYTVVQRNVSRNCCSVSAWNPGNRMHANFKGFPVVAQGMAVCLACLEGGKGLGLPPSPYTNCGCSRRRGSST